MLSFCAKPLIVLGQNPSLQAWMRLNVTSVMKEMADGMGLGPVSTSFGTGFDNNTFSDPSAMIMQMMGPPLFCVLEISLQ